MPSRKAPLISIRKVQLGFFHSVVPGFVLLGALTGLTARPAAENQNSKEAARLNGIGVALMNQQLTEKAAAKLQEAYAADPAVGDSGAESRNCAAVRAEAAGGGAGAAGGGKDGAGQSAGLVQPGADGDGRGESEGGDRGHAQGAGDRREGCRCALFCGVAGPEPGEFR